MPETTTAETLKALVTAVGDTQPIQLTYQKSSQQHLTVVRDGLTMYDGVVRIHFSATIHQLAERRPHEKLHVTLINIPDSEQAQFDKMLGRLLSEDQNRLMKNVEAKNLPAVLDFFDTKRQYLAGDQLKHVMECLRRLREVNSIDECNCVLSVSVEARPSLLRGEILFQSPG